MSLAHPCVIIVCKHPDKLDKRNCETVVTHFEKALAELVTNLMAHLVHLSKKTLERCFVITMASLCY